MPFLVIFLFLLGTALGSFLNVSAIRFLSGESFVSGRSRCPACARTLSWFELIPIASFFYLSRRCRTCHVPISIRYLLVEVGMGAATTALGLAVFRGTLFSPFDGLLLVSGPASLVFLFFLHLLVVASAFFVMLVDFDSQTIPVFVTRALSILGLLLLFIQAVWLGDKGAWWVMLAAFSLGSFFFLIWAITRGAGMGLGDGELAFALSLYLPPLGAAGLLLFSFWIGALWSIGLLAFSRYSLKSRIPFGPFIVLGFYGVLFLGKLALPYILPL